MTAAVFAFSEDLAPATRLAEALGRPLREIALHRFPDGESLPQVGQGAEVAILYRALEDPDPKLMPLLLAADALRRAGARRLVLVAPYMPYLRQDMVFEPGQPLSRDVMGALLGPAFDRIVTVEPHLHRTSDLTPVFAGRPVTVLSASALLADAIGPAGDPLIIGPDAESAPWAQAVADRLGAGCLVFEKQRYGDRHVRLTLPEDAEIAGRRVAIVDDICSSGGTLAEAVKAVVARGAETTEIAVVHALFDARAEARLMRAGARRIVSTDAVEHPTNAIHLAGLLAGALEQEF
ncbi:ribose-phosphate diphosphokinase [Phenylobacterium soli]|uniref:Phosphoribosylpyrophosphate synthetase n=1 Tax=Phenylobacterium soli TaxID=2170551 RepID=A0A328AH85_9CAUL|nr:ribose-phosphate diphosphokinase [Phenylobacterium soli]RAK54019.1 phosphoribosylpyrophosphate synthetase [Phenylobacterium soli]